MRVLPTIEAIDDLCSPTDARYEHDYQLTTHLSEATVPLPLVFIKGSHHQLQLYRNLRVTSQQTKAKSWCTAKGSK